MLLSIPESEDESEQTGIFQGEEFGEATFASVYDHETQWDESNERFESGLPLWARLSMVDARDRVSWYLQGSRPSMPAQALLPNIIEALTEAIKSPSPEVRVRGMRIAANWRIKELTEQIEKQLDADEYEVAVEAAWALAALASDKASEAAVQLLSRDLSADLKLHLAILLESLEHDAAKHILHEAEAVTLVRRLRARCVSIRDQKPQVGLAGFFGVGPVNQTEQIPIADAQLLHWNLRQLEELLDKRNSQAYNKRLETLNLGKSYFGYDEYYYDDHFVWNSTIVPKERRRFYLNSRGFIEFAGTVGQGLAGDFIIDSGGSLGSLPIRMVVLETNQETDFFVQFADQADSPRELMKLWQTWWTKNKDQSPNEWWRQAVGQATNELNDDRWWFRLRGAFRYERLTGRTLDLPAVLDREGWTELQLAVQKDNKANQDKLPAEIVLSSAKQTTGANIDSVSTENATNLEKLVELAGWHEGVIATAALRQLNHWPNKTELLQAALRWQHSPKPELRQWIQSQVVDHANHAKLFYSKQDIP